MARINNFQENDLIIKPPIGNRGLPVIFSLSGDNMAGVIVIKPGTSAEVPYWDEIKNHPVYVSKLDRGLISVGDDKPEVRHQFSTFGDTLVAPDRLDPQAMKEEASAEKVKNLAYEQEPAITTKRRGRPAKAETTEGE